MAFYLVTGGAGFIGSHMVEALRRRGDRVRVADSFVTGKRSNLAHIDEVEVLEGDLADPAFAVRAVEGVDYVLHQAAIPSVPRSVEDPITSNRANIDATLEPARRGTRCGREARRLRRQFVGVRQRGRRSQARGHADRPAVALRAAETGRRAVHADVHGRSTVCPP